MIPLITVTLAGEQDVVVARQRARQVASLLALDTQDQTRIATAVSELARNAFEYAGGGRVEFSIDDESDPICLIARISDRGPGVRDLDAVLSGTYVSPTGMGLGIMGARRLSDRFQISSTPGVGTTVEIGKCLPRRKRPPLAELSKIAAALTQQSPETPFDELQRQNQELVVALDEAARRRLEADRLNAELAETNRGVLALYAELDDRASDLKRASETKTRFLSEMSHELRTPLASILSLSWMLLDRIDGDLTPEQEKQVNLIRRAGQTLSDLVNDLLDLAKIEAGAMSPRISEFTVGELFAALRGMFRPLMMGSNVSLVFDEGREVLTMHSDEGRVSQILRNFVSNAIKFTERGEIRVTATRDGDMVRFDVQDTGIGIAPADQERIFNDFEQIDSSVQRRVRGTGLGLPVSNKLALLLGGSITVTSTLGKGSTFTVHLPLRIPTPEHADDSNASSFSSLTAE